MIRRKSLWLAVAAILLLTLVFGAASCGAKSVKVRVTVGMLPDFSVASPEADYYKECITRFERDNPGYEIVSSPYSYNQSTVIAKATSGQLPVVFQSYASETGWLADGGYISPVTELLDEFGWTGKMEDSIEALLTSSGEIYGVPREGSGMGMLLNLSMLAEAGVIAEDENGYVLRGGASQYPDTFDKVRDCARSVKEEYGESADGIALLSADTYGGRQFENIAWNFGGGDLQAEDQDGRWVSRFNVAACVTAMRWVQDVCREKLAVATPAYLSYSDLYDAIGYGRAAIAFCTNLDVSIILSNYDIDKADVAFLPMPAAGEEFRGSVGDGTAYLFSSKATPAQIRGAALFLKYLGRSPDTDDTGSGALRRRFEARKSIGQPIIPEIEVWKDRAYETMHAALENEYVDVRREYYADFFDSYGSVRKTSAPHFRSAMYGLLDGVMQKMLASPNAYNVYTLLSAANTTFQTEYLDRLNR